MHFWRQKFLISLSFEHTVRAGIGGIGVFYTCTECTGALCVPAYCSRVSVYSDPLYQSLTSESASYLVLFQYAWAYNKVLHAGNTDRFVNAAIVISVAL